VGNAKRGFVSIVSKSAKVVKNGFVRSAPDCKIARCVTALSAALASKSVVYAKSMNVAVVGTVILVYATTAARVFATNASRIAVNVTILFVRALFPAKDALDV